jgi:hypothetical protein
MTLKSIAPKRTVVLTVQTDDNGQPQPGHSRSASSGITIAIGVMIDDGTQVTECTFCNAAEIHLLRCFWRVVRPGDVFIGNAVSNDLAFLRRRSWNRGLIPSHEIDLNTVYQHETLDLASLRAMTGGDEYGSAEALLSMFGFPAHTSSDKNNH